MSTYNIHFQDKMIALKLSQHYYYISSHGEKFQGTQNRVRNSRGKRATSVRAIEGLLYIQRQDAPQSE